MAAKTLLAIAEDGGYRLEEAKRLTRRYIREVLQHERDEKTHELVLPVPKGHAPRSPEDRLWELFRVTRKLPEWIAAQKVRQFGKQAGQSGRQAKRRPKKR